jgi:hypothetical protein|eukprot:COSAG01_NODE_310_length_19129_cov_22.110615_3_plen_84_part_00
MWQRCECECGPVSVVLARQRHAGVLPMSERHVLRRGVGADTTAVLAVHGRLLLPAIDRRGRLHASALCSRHLLCWEQRGVPRV